jgi:hypothetical protein
MGMEHRVSADHMVVAAPRQMVVVPITVMWRRR